MPNLTLVLLALFTLSAPPSQVVLDSRVELTSTPAKTLDLYLGELGIEILPELPSAAVDADQEAIFLMQFLEYTYQNLPAIAREMQDTGVGLDGTLATLDATRVRQDAAGELVGAHYEACYQLVKDYQHSIVVAGIVGGKDTAVNPVDALLVSAQVGMVALDVISHNYWAAAADAGFLLASLRDAASWNRNKRKVLTMEIERLERRYLSATATLDAAIAASGEDWRSSGLYSHNPFTEWAKLRGRRLAIDNAADARQLYHEYQRLVWRFPRTAATVHWRASILLDAAESSNFADFLTQPYYGDHPSAQKTSLDLFPILAAAEAFRFSPESAEDAVLIELSRSLAFAGAHRTARDILGHVPLSDDYPMLCYRGAKLHSLTHDSKEALAALRAALNLGFALVKFAKTDPDLAFVRADRPTDFAELFALRCRWDVRGSLLPDILVRNDSRYPLTNVRVVVSVTFANGSELERNHIFERIEPGATARWYNPGFSNLLQGWRATLALDCDQGKSDLLTLDETL